MVSLLETLPIAQARIEEYFGMWSIEPRHGRDLEAAIRSMDWAQHVGQFEQRRLEAAAARRADPAAGPAYAVTSDGIAVISLSGPVMKQESSLGGASTVATRRAVRAAAADPQISGIMLVIDSPGGTTAGVEDLAGDIAAAGKSKLVWAYAEDCCCSAAYHIASQASRLVGGPSAMVGSIGTYLVARDFSANYAAEGIKTYVVKAGEFKGAGTQGTEITPEQLAEMQRLVDSVNARFLAAVSSGRKMSAEQVSKIADGSVHVGAAAQSMGLLDGVASLDQTLAEMSQEIRRKGVSKMSTTENKPAAATSAEIRAACPNASAEFILAQIEKGATEVEALKAFALEQSKQLEAANKAKADAQQAQAAAETKADAANKPKPGAAGVPEAAAAGSGEGSGTDLVAQFEQLVEAKVKAGKPRHEAIRAVSREHEELRAAWVASHNEKHPHHSR